jgi:predicted nucleic acid-binding protein
MGVLIDTAVFIRWERERRQVDFGQWSSYGNAGVSVITASELLIGVRRANSEERRLRREAFVEGSLSRLPATVIMRSSLRTPANSSECQA